MKVLLLKITVDPTPELNVPKFVKFSHTVKVLFEFSLSIAPGLIKTDFALAGALMAGCNIIPPFTIASNEQEGIAQPPQFSFLNQSVSIPPDQLTALNPPPP